MSQMFQRARAVLENGAASRVYPCAVAEVGRTGRALDTLTVGRLSYEPQAAAAGPFTLFDLASLTKVLATTHAAMRLVEQGRIDLAERVRRLPAWRGEDRREVTVRDLMEHCSGLPAHRPYFARLSGRDAYECAISAEPLEYPPRSRSLYSDLGFILLGFVLEDAGGVPLDGQFDDWRECALGPAVRLRFGPADSEETAPTGEDRWRRRILRGEVHDENAAALGGVAGHAGLFGTADAVGAAARWWLRLLAGEPSAGVSAATARRFISRSSVPGSSRALGWDTMLPTSSCGARLSPRAFGHTGFTGTSLWIDPAQDLYVVLLTNRVHPTREGDAIQDIRRAFHDAVVADLADQPTEL
jgi:CubicO group peptidase (beta-lactamase class C family)